VVGSRFVPLPAGFAEALAVWIESPAGRRPLHFTEPALIGACSLQGEPGAWSVDRDRLAFERPCDQAYGFTLRMLARFALSNTAPSNALLTDYPDVYLFATLCEAAPFLRDAELAGAYQARLERAIGEVNAKDARNRAARTLTTELTPGFLEARG
jgi:hypothetical protein